MWLIKVMIEFDSHCDWFYYSAGINGLSSIPQVVYNVQQAMNNQARVWTTETWVPNAKPFEGCRIYPCISN